jgi:L-seryl-tRNA(Ser) seleniumtransferase
MPHNAGRNRLRPLGIEVAVDSQAIASRKLPSVDEVLRAASEAVATYGHTAVVAEIREFLALARAEKRPAGVSDIANAVVGTLEKKARPNLTSVFNLTGTVLHTNLGRALYSEAAIEAAVEAMRNAVALEFDLGGGHRGDRDDLVCDLLCELTGAEDATVVNNNAAAVLLVLNSLAKGKETVISRGELIEIGGAFRMPEIMNRAGTKLVEIGTTNRTHMKDYESAIGARSGLILKVHTSNYHIEGFTKTVGARELSGLAKKHDVPLVNDLGSGTLIDLVQFGLAHEPTVREAVAEGADLVTFSGDKLLGGPQVGFVVGRKDLVKRIKKNPLKRALRVDKVRLAALEATLRLYRDPDSVGTRLPTLRMLSRSQSEIRSACARMLPAIAERLAGRFAVTVEDTASQIGSGALPTETVASAGLFIRPLARKGAGRALSAISKALRGLRVPVVGRIEDNALVLDLRCLEDEPGFVKNLAHLLVADLWPEAAP